MYFSQEKEKATAEMTDAEKKRIEIDNKKAEQEGKKITAFPSDNTPITDNEGNVIGYNLTSYDTLNEVYGRQIDKDDIA